MGRQPVKINRPKDLKEYGFEVPERLRETLAPSVAPDAALAMAHLSRRRVCGPFRLGD